MFSRLTKYFYDDQPSRPNNDELKKQILSLDEKDKDEIRKLLIAQTEVVAPPPSSTEVAVITPSSTEMEVVSTDVVVTHTESTEVAVVTEVPNYEYKEEPYKKN